MNLKLKELHLGQYYTIAYTNKYMFTYPQVLCKFVKVTPKGYNLLNVKTNKCIMKKHLYPSKYEEHKGTLTFFLPRKLEIRNVSLAELIKKGFIPPIKYHNIEIDIKVEPHVSTKSIKVKLPAKPKKHTFSFSFRSCYNNVGVWCKAHTKKEAIRIFDEAMYFEWDESKENSETICEISDNIPFSYKQIKSKRI